MLRALQSPGGGADRTTAARNHVETARGTAFERPADVGGLRGQQWSTIGPVSLSPVVFYSSSTFSPKRERERERESGLLTRLIGRLIPVTKKKIKRTWVVSGHILWVCLSICLH